MSTKNGAVLSTQIVPEVLTNGENYYQWSIRLQTYLMAQDVWDVIESTSNKAAAGKVWRKKNATALHAIHISCGPVAFSLIQHITNAKEAWDKLAESMVMAGPEPLTQAAIQVNNISSVDKSLYKAVRNGESYLINRIISSNRCLVRAKITSSGRIPLHVAAMAGHIGIVKILVEKMSKEDLETTDGDGFTALAVAIRSNAKLSIAKCMVEKNKELLTIETNNMLPVAMAFSYGYKEMGRYLYSIMVLLKDYLPEIKKHRARILCSAIHIRSFDVALHLLSEREELSITDPGSTLQSPVYALANLSSAFPSGCHLRFWQRWLYHCICIDSTSAINHILTELQNLHSHVIEGNTNISEGSTTISAGRKVWSKLQGLKFYVLELLGIKDLYDKKLVHVQTSELLRRMSYKIKDLESDQLEESFVIDALFLAVDGGNVEFVQSMLEANPLLEETVDESCRNVFMRAIQFRQPKIFSLIYNSNSKLPATTATAFQKNNMLHIAAILPPKQLLNRFSGAALQMQRELQWFQEVKSIVPSWALDRKNLLKEMTPGELFTEEHKQLVIEGEKWMKETASSCTVVGALIITITFAAAFTVPGGNNEHSGFPIFSNKKWFRIFVISDSLSLFSSATSVLMFLGILTSRYAEEDFLISLPRKLMIGLSTLFFSIVSMMAAFCATLLIVLGDKYSWISILVFSLAGIPVILFVLQQFSLLADLLQSTHGSMFDKKVKI